MCRTNHISKVLLKYLNIPICCCCVLFFGFNSLGLGLLEVFAFYNDIPYIVYTFLNTQGNGVSNNRKTGTLTSYYTNLETKCYSKQRHGFTQTPLRVHMWILLQILTTISGYFIFILPSNCSRLSDTENIL